MIHIPLSNTPAGRRFFGGFLMGGSSVGRVIKFLGGIQQNLGGRAVWNCWGVGLSCERHDMQWPTVIANSSWGPGGAVSLPVGPGQSPGGDQGAKPLEGPGISHFLGSWEWPKISEEPAAYRTTKDTKIAFPMQCVIFSLFYNCLVKKNIEKSVLRKLSAVLHKN